ncbi:C6 transcription factor [Aspergillus terreus]|uniref:C6 transcription factor n=1 Tax=Aspergillus terreus TaxID=33178 RepID=A0A5M3Z8T7_ASPTE|nr:hypothetical protein ATETN484_0011055700 [Aspergillus terreus]GFF19199.1 C6 transcription factor [Aspergillus terreus]
MADWLMRFSKKEAFPGIERRRRGDQFASHARKLFDLTNISVETIQSCILLGTICYADAQPKSETLYYSVAIRLALILDIPRRQCTDEIERQVNLRNEETFLSLHNGAKITASPHGRGVWAEMAVLSQIWAQIHELNKQSVGENMDSNALNHTVDDLARQLYRWAAALPSTLQETAENLQRYTALGLGNAFAALHLGYHYYFEVLFYRFLAKSAGSDPANPSIRGYRRQCEEHALAFCDLLYRSRATDQCQCLYGMVGHMLVVTSTIYIHILLFSDQEEQVSLARQRLALNFKILTDLQSFWVTLDVALSRLQVFHNACNRSIDESFRMDQWMLTFILEHGSSVTERTFPGSPSLPGTLQGWYAQEFTS